MKLKSMMIILLTLFFFVAPAFANGFQEGKVTRIDRDKQMIEIDKKRYYCLPGDMLNVRKGDEIEFRVDRNYDDPKHPVAVVEIYKL